MHVLTTKNKKILLSMMRLPLTYLLAFSKPLITFREKKIN